MSIELWFDEEIAAPPEEVFRLYTSPDEMRRWQPIRRFLAMRGRPDRPGARFIVDLGGLYKRWMRVQSVDPPRAHTYWFRHLFGSGDYVATFEPSASGTHFRLLVRLRGVRPLASAMERSMLEEAEPVHRRDVACLKTLAERGHQRRAGIRDPSRQHQPSEVPLGARHHAKEQVDLSVRALDHIVCRLHRLDSFEIATARRPEAAAWGGLLTA